MIKDQNKKIYEIEGAYCDKGWELLKELFPIYRSVLGVGFDRSLEMIKKIIPISILKFPSGKKCGSWIIPQEWVVRDAYISTLDGKKIIDFNENHFHVWQYSIPFSGIVSKEELLGHISTAPLAPDAIPLRVTYYNKNWGFSMSEKQLNGLKDASYRVCVDSEFKNGELEIGELYIKGKTSSEIVIDAVLSSPSLANNLSGVVAAVFLADMITRIENRKFSYRILFTPETIGPLALHHLYKKFGSKVVGGFNLINLAGKSKFHYKKSRQGDTLADRAMLHALRFFGKDYVVEDYDVRTGSCGNEKAYNSLGIEIPIGSLRRNPLGSYPEYDTSLDDLTFVNKENLFESLRLIWGAIQTLERSKKYLHQFEGEPFLSGYGLFPKISSDEERLPYDYLMGYTDGKLTLVDIAEKAGLIVTKFDEAVSLMEHKGLIKEIKK